MDNVRYFVAAAGDVRKCRIISQDYENFTSRIASETFGDSEKWTYNIATDRLLTAEQIDALHARLSKDRLDNGVHPS